MMQTASQKSLAAPCCASPTTARAYLRRPLACAAAVARHRSAAGRFSSLAHGARLDSPTVARMRQPQRGREAVRARATLQTGKISASQKLQTRCLQSLCFEQCSETRKDSRTVAQSGAAARARPQHGSHDSQMTCWPTMPPRLPFGRSIGSRLAASPCRRPDGRARRAMAVPRLAAPRGARRNPVENRMCRHALPALHLPPRSAWLQLLAWRRRWRGSMSACRRSAGPVFRISSSCLPPMSRGFRQRRCQSCERALL